MSNYVEYNDTIAFHPGYYIKEIIDESGLTQEDFAKRLDTSPKNISLLVRGEQSLSIDIALKLSRMLGTSVEYWMNLQNKFDTLVAEFKSQEEIIEERGVFSCLDYKYFRENFGLPDLPRKKELQIKEVREFLKVSTLSVIKKRNLSVSFRSCKQELSDANIIKANAMVQIAINEAVKIDAPKYNREEFKKAIKYALTLTKDHKSFYPKIRDAFKRCGVILVILPNINGSKINGATKKVGKNVLLMVNDRRLYSDTFWFTLFHESGHIINGDYGITFDKDKSEDEADKFAEDSLIPPELYEKFLEKGIFDSDSIKEFANVIDRDPGIVLGRLHNDKKVEYNDWKLGKEFSHKYKIKISM